MLPLTCSVPSRILSNESLWGERVSSVALWYGALRGARSFCFWDAVMDWPSGRTTRKSKLDCSSVESFRMRLKIFYALGRLA